MVSAYGDDDDSIDGITGILDAIARTAETKKGVYLPALQGMDRNH